MQQLIVYQGGRERPTRTSLLDMFFRSDDVTLIGITHRQLPEALNRALGMRSSFWRRIQIIYPNINNIHRLIDDGHIPSERLDEWESSRVTVQMILESKTAQFSRQWSCSECMQPLSFVGARAMCGRQSTIHFTPLLSGMDPRELVAINVAPNSSLFQQVSQAIDLTVRNSAAIVEWDVVGLPHEDPSAFRYYGIVPRVSIGAPEAPRNVVFPIVVILLYIRSLEGTYVVLQERTPFNATNDLGKLSTISTRVTTADVVTLHPGRFWMNFDVNNRAATATFSALSGLFEGSLLDTIVWRRAASRGLREELGLDVTLSRLEDWRQVAIERDGMRQYFQVFALELRQDALVDELSLITRKRPKAVISKYRLNELQQLHNSNRLNHLLQTQYESVFLPLFQQINVIP